MIFRVGWKSLGMALAAATSLLAQLTPEQKAIDFQSIASLYAKQYAPYEWKRDNFGFDLLDLRPWLDRVRASRSDIEYLELVAEYTARLQDIHSYAVVNSDFTADLHLFTDVFEGKVLIEVIDRGYLPASRFDFAVGDEVVQIDGKPVEEALREIARLSSFGNPRSTQRWAADQLVYRQQSYLPGAADLGATATLLIRRQDGSEKSYTIPWDKTGTPLRRLGPLPNFLMGRGAERASGDERAPAGPEAERTEAGQEERIPAFRKALAGLQSHVSARRFKGLRGFGARTPVYRMPAGFTQRLGRLQSEYFYSGTMAAGDGKRIGLIRIGTFQPVSFASLGVAVRQFEQEIGYMKANTDALVVDVTRNSGGYACYAETLASYLVARPYTAVGVEIRPNLNLVREFEYSYLDAQDFGEAWEAALYGALLRDIRTAYGENRGRTGPMPLCGPGLEMEPARDRNGAVLAYGKPVLLLTDEFSVSAAETFAATLQDAGAAKLFGYRTAGAGGNTVTVSAGFFSEGRAAVTQMLTVRPKAQASPGYPVSRYIENIGVRPDIDYDYQTKENLTGNGAAFVNAFLREAASLLSGGK